RDSDPGAFTQTSGVRFTVWSSIFRRRSAKYAVSSPADFTLPREHEPVEHPPPVPHDEHPLASEPHPGLPHPACCGSSFATGERGRPPARRATAARRRPCGTGRRTRACRTGRGTRRSYTTAQARFGTPLPAGERSPHEVRRVRGAVDAPSPGVLGCRLARHPLPAGERV